MTAAAPVTRRASWRGMPVTVLKHGNPGRPDYTVTGTLLGWGPLLLKVRTRFGAYVEIPTAVIVRVTTDA